MRKILLIMTVLFFSIAQAADPTTSASNIQFPINLVDGGAFTVSFSSGNGTGGRIVVVKEGSDITGTPVDGVKYNFNVIFGTAGTAFTAPGEFVVAHVTGTAPNVTVTNLKAGTTYYVAIFELNGNYNTPSTIDYSTVTPTDKKITTQVAPTVQGSIANFTQVTGNSLKVNWTNGNGQGRIIVAKKGSSLTAIPEDLKSYNFLAAFGNGSAKLDAETFVLYKSSNQTSADITNLEPATAYTFAMFEYNGNNSPVYLNSIATKTVTTNAGPTQGSTSITFSKVDGNWLELYWNKGNGAQALVVIKKGGAVTNVPENGKTYAASTVFGNAEWYPGSGEYVISSSTSNSVTVTGLEKATVYHFAVFVFDADINGYKYYYSSSFQKSQSTVTAPTGQSTITVGTITGNSAKLTYNAPASGGGAYRMLVIKEGTPTDFLPEDFKTYPQFSDTYGTGTPVAPNTYILIGQGNGGVPTVKGLLPGHTYYVTVFEMNGQTAPVYKTPGSTSVIVVPNEPTTGPTNPNFVTVEGNFMRFDWTNGDGARRIVIAKKGSAVTSIPQDGTIYTASAVFGNMLAEMVPASGEFVVYNGSSNSVTITTLEKATTYHFAVFEYNLDGSSPDYLTSASKYLITSKATVSAPVVQVSNLNAINILSDRATINFTVGNGYSRIFLMRESEPVNAEPTDFTSYSTTGNVFGGATTQLGTSNYVVGVGNASSFTVTGLKPGTQYYVTAFEYNGVSAPVYLRPGAVVYSFTTSGGISVTAPTIAADNALFENTDGNKFGFKWTNGNGANRIVVARKNNAVSFAPVDGIVYAANASFGSTTDLGNGQYIVYNGNENTVALTNLEPNTNYHFAVYEYNGTAATIKYGASALQADHSTATPPTTKSIMPVTTIASNAITLSWTNGNGSGRVVVAKEGTEVTAIPAVLNKYTANSVFKNGPQLATGEYVVYAGTSNSVTVTGLEENKTYHFSIFEYNGTDAPVYNTTDVLKTSALVSSTLPVTWLYVTAKEKNGIAIIEWATAAELHNEFFGVQKSTDGMHYTTISKIKASGNSNANRYYSYTDGTVNGTVYYRIQQVDIDGKSSYSKVVKIMIAAYNKVQLLQNPVQDNLRLKCTEEQLGGVLIITDAYGRMVNKSIITSTSPVVATDKLAKGVYYVSVQEKNGKTVQTIPFVHQ